LSYTWQFTWNGIAKRMALHGLAWHGMAVKRINMKKMEWNDNVNTIFLKLLFIKIKKSY
jgi:hypothetical protein